MSDTRADRVDDAFEAWFVGNDIALDRALTTSAQAGLPPIAVSATQGKLLHILARMCGARRILEVGTLGGYSAIWLGRALAPGGRLITLEIDPAHADVARDNLKAAGLAAVAEVRLGAALDSLDSLIAAKAPPFDLVFIDADKRNNPAYLRRALTLSHPGTVVIVDNVVRGGAVLDETSGDANVAGTRAVLEMLATDPRLCATALQTVGHKGYDGFAIAIVT